MRVLVISDIHANITAMEAVLTAAGTAGIDYDFVWCLGDIVGYGPDPNECIELLCGLPHKSLAGNHDWAVIGKGENHAFNTFAQHSIVWTQSVLTSEHEAYLKTLLVTGVQGDFTLAHASPRDPLSEYIIGLPTANQNFLSFQTPHCLVGHTHTCFIYRKIGNGTHCEAVNPVYGVPISLVGARYLLNPGSVGQPRDDDPRAAYAILDTELQSWEFRRVSYDVLSVQRRMLKIEMPAILIQRLEKGW
jgi:diadenosine tetraphosphatase ApaH/serine/threonine PP2A family protein phosphatase